MGLLLDPQSPVEHRIEDVTFLIRCFTSREYARFLKLVAPIQERMAKAQEEGGEVSTALTVEMMEHMGEALLMGIAQYMKGAALHDFDEKALDRVPFRVWGELYGKIIEVNSVSGEDEKN